MKRSPIGLVFASMLACAPPGTYDDGSDVPLDEDILCQAKLTVTGTLDPEGGIVPPADGGCAPQGTWTVNVAVSDEAGCAPINVEEQYVYIVTVDPLNGKWNVEFPADPTADVSLGVKQSGPGLCEGSFTHYAGDEEIILKPFEENLSFSGYGTFTRFKP